MANYYDPTLLRNPVAFFMGNQLSSLDYTPHFDFVNLTLNGQYQGIYQLGEKIKISKDRVNAGDDGFLLEIDAKYSPDDVIFWCKKLQAPINIKEPDVEEGDDNYYYVNSFVTTAENVLLSDYFTDENTGYQQFFDIDSFVDKVKTRFNFYFDNRETIYKYIDSEAECIREFIVDENKLWGLLCPPDSEKDVVLASYHKEVEKLKDWLKHRFQWLNDNL